MLTMAAAGSRKRATKDQKESPRVLGFEESARSVLREVREAFARLVAAAPGAPGRRSISKAADFHKALGVDAKLGWQVFRVARAENPLETGSDLPSRVSMQRLFKAAAKHEVPAEVIERAAAAFDHYETLVHEHAGDRESFASMISGLTVGGSAEIDLQYRKAAFKANSHLWGTQARAKIACAIIQPSEDDPMLFDAVFLRGVVGLRQLRRDRPFTISKIAITDNDNVIRRNPDVERLDVVHEQHGINLLRDYCTHPLPRTRNFTNGTGELVTQLLNNDVGSSASFNGFLCDVYRKGGARFHDEHNHSLTLVSQIDSPFEVAQVDALVRRGTFGPAPLTFNTRTVNALQSPATEDSDVLMTGEAAARFGSGPSGLHTADFPQYVEMIEYVMERLGWNLAEFEAYRCRVDYPVMPSGVIMECPLLEPPA